MQEDLLLERKIAEYGQEDKHVVRRSRHNLVRQIVHLSYMYLVNIEESRTTWVTVWND